MMDETVYRPHRAWAKKLIVNRERSPTLRLKKWCLGLAARAPRAEGSWCWDHQSLVGEDSVGHDRHRAREVHQVLIEIEGVAADAVRADLDLVRPDDFRLPSGVAFGGDGLVPAVDEVLRQLGDAGRRGKPAPSERPGMR